VYPLIFYSKKKKKKRNINNNLAIWPSYNKILHSPRLSDPGIQSLFFGTYTFQGEGTACIQ